MKNSPRVFSSHHEGRIWQTQFDCGDGWYDVIDQFGISLQALTQQTDISLFVRHINSHLGSIRVVWETRNELLAVERASIIQAILHHSMKSRLVCEVCGRPLQVLNLNTPKCNNHDRK